MMDNGSFNPTSCTLISESENVVKVLLTTLLTSSYQ